MKSVGITLMPGVDGNKALVGCESVGLTESQLADRMIVGLIAEEKLPLLEAVEGVGSVKVFGAQNEGAAYIDPFITAG